VISFSYGIEIKSLSIEIKSLSAAALQSLLDTGAQHGCKFRHLHYRQKLMSQRPKRHTRRKC